MMKRYTNIKRKIQPLPDNRGIFQYDAILKKIIAQLKSIFIRIVISFLIIKFLGMLDVSCMNRFDPSFPRRPRSWPVPDAPVKVPAIPEIPLTPEEALYQDRKNKIMLVVCIVCFCISLYYEPGGFKETWGF